jgi:hypothetical protein
METAIRLIREMAELLRTRLNQVVIIALAGALYYSVKHNIECEARSREDSKENTQQIIAIFKETLQKNMEVMDKVTIIVDRIDSVSNIKK